MLVYQRVNGLDKQILQPKSEFGSSRPTKKIDRPPLDLDIPSPKTSSKTIQQHRCNIENTLAIFRLDPGSPSASPGPVVPNPGHGRPVMNFSELEVCPNFNIFQQCHVVKHPISGPVLGTRGMVGLSPHSTVEKLLKTAW